MRPETKESFCPNSSPLRADQTPKKGALFSCGSARPCVVPLFKTLTATLSSSGIAHQVQSSPVQKHPAQLSSSPRLPHRGDVVLPLPLLLADDPAARVGFRSSRTGSRPYDERLRQQGLDEVAPLGRDGTSLFSPRTAARTVSEMGNHSRGGCVCQTLSLDLFLPESGLVRGPRPPLSREMPKPVVGVSWEFRRSTDDDASLYSGTTQHQHAFRLQFEVDQSGPPFTHFCGVKRVTRVAERRKR